MRIMDRTEGELARRALLSSYIIRAVDYTRHSFRIMFKRMPGLGWEVGTWQAQRIDSAEMVFVINTDGGNFHCWR